MIDPPSFYTSVLKHLSPFVNADTSEQELGNKALLW